MCVGSHLGIEAIQRYANPEIFFVVINVIQYCKVFQIYRFFRNDINLSSILTKYLANLYKW